MLLALALVLTSVTASTDERLRLALESAAAGDEAGAEQALGALVEDAPEFAPAWTELAAVRNRTGRFAGALEAADTAVARAPDDDLPLIERARALAGLGDARGAIAAYGAALDCRERAGTRVELAALLVRRREPERAIAELEAARADDPTLVLPGRLGHALYLAGRNREAAAAFARAEHAGRLDPGFVIEHGRALEDLADLEAAVALYQAALAWFPGDPRPPRRLGSVLLELGRAEAALAALERSRNLDPGAAETHEKIGLALGKLGRGEEAASALGEAVRIEPGFARAWYALGTILADLGRDAEAEEALARFREAEAARARGDQSEGRIATLNREGLRLLREERPLDAIERFEQAIEIGPKRGAVHANLGLALLAAGNPGQAAVAIRRAIALDGESPELLRLLAAADAKRAGGSR